MSSNLVNKVNNKLLELVRDIGILWEDVSIFNQEEDEKSLRILSNSIEIFDNSCEEVRLSLKEFIKEVANVENEEINVVETENGKEII